MKDSVKHDEYNKRILDFLNDRYTIINDNHYTIAIEVADDTNINKFAIQGVTSLPAMTIGDTNEFIYGVNSILSQLAQLEISIPSKSIPDIVQETNNSTSNAFYDMVLEEMKNSEQEDPDAPSTLRPYHQDLPETPLTEKMIDEKSKAYDKIYEERRKRNPARQVRQNPKSAPTSINVEKLIQDGGYDKGEELLMRQIVQNL